MALERQEPVEAERAAVGGPLAREGQEGDAAEGGGEDDDPDGGDLEAHAQAVELVEPVVRGGDVLVQHVGEMRGGDGVRGGEAVGAEAVGRPEGGRGGAAGEEEEGEGGRGGGGGGEGVRSVQVERRPEVLPEELDVHVEVPLVHAFFLFVLVLLAPGGARRRLEVEREQASGGPDIGAGMPHRRVSDLLLAACDVPGAAAVVG